MTPLTWRLIRDLAYTVILAWFLIAACSSCSKEPGCSRAEMIIERYKLSGELIRTTTWWVEPCYEGGRLPVAQWYYCEPEGWKEKYYYTLGGIEVK